MVPSSYMLAAARVWTLDRNGIIVYWLGFHLYQVKNESQNVVQPM